MRFEGNVYFKVSIMINMPQFTAICLGGIRKLFKKLNARENIPTISSLSRFLKRNTEGII